ncbi:MAG: molybdenum cofactor carrier protein [bacterium]
MRRTIIGVIGSGRERHEELASPLGVWLGQHGYHLLTGGGQGVMASVSEAFSSVPDRQGMVIGIIPAQDLYQDTGRANFRPKPGYPNEWVDIPVITHLPFSGTRGKENLSRNHINVLTPRVIIALPGGAGTVSEIELALEYRKPLLIFDPFALMPDYSKEGALHLATLEGIISHLRGYPPIV